MAVRHRFAQEELPELETMEEVKEKINKDNFVLIVFNKKFFDKDIEYGLNMCRSIYENTRDLHCYKYIVEPEDLPFTIDAKLKITSVPTILLFRNGEQVDRIDQSNVYEPNIPKEEEKNPLDYSLRQRLDRWCPAQKPVLQQSSAST